VVAEDGRHLETMATLKAYRTLKLISYCAKTLGLGMSVLGKFPPLPWDSQAFSQVFPQWLHGQGEHRKECILLKHLETY
jgi:hypothetical protein